MNRRWRGMRLAANFSLQAGLRRLSAVSGALLHKPTRLRLEITRDCNLKCGYCDVWRGAGAGALPLGTWLALLREAAGWLGPVGLSFGSGEPLTAPDLLFPLIAEGSRLGFLTTCVSNGTLIDEKTADGLCASGLGRLLISLDAPDAATHDAIRGRAGTFALALAGLRRVMSRGVRPDVGLLTVVTAANAGKLPAMLELAAAEGVGGVTLQPLSSHKPCTPGLRAVAQKDLRRSFDKLREMKAAGYPLTNSLGSLRLISDFYLGMPYKAPALSLCGSFSTLRVACDGEVRACAHKPPLGRVSDAPLRAIWAAGWGSGILRRVSGCRAYCMLNNTDLSRPAGERLREFLRHFRAAAGGGDAQ
ncbi:MAG: radical SAM protein [Elusimicrobia bacterium]|nr:radical SAM protein [Elusimicrobiota bacterium]